jgi:peptidyl-prolyl cis-trans isomerase SurA
MLAPAYRKYSRKPDADRLMLDKFNKKNDSLLIINEGKWFTGDDPQIDKIQWIKGAQLTRINNYPSLLVINRIMEPEPLPLEEVRGEMMTGYQEYLENEWITQLKEKYPVKIDSAVLSEVKKSLNNE